MSLPQTIAVTYTEEEAEYLSLRPLVRQTFSMRELVDLVLAVTGKDLPRVQKVLRSGTVVFHFYRYWWPGFEAAAEDLQAVLREFPDADPAWPFRAADCIAVLVESSAHRAPRPAELRRDHADKKSLFRRLSFWKAILELAAVAPPSYSGYSYERRADLYSRSLSPPERDALLASAQHLAARTLRPHALAAFAGADRLVFVCPRPV